MKFKEEPKEKILFWRNMFFIVLIMGSLFVGFTSAKDKDESIFCRYLDNGNPVWVMNHQVISYGLAKEIPWDGVTLYYDKDSDYELKQINEWGPEKWLDFKKNKRAIPC